MSETSKAVFLSYASQDAEAAKRICDALRAAGVEVWFDQSELVGGDAWDQKIRKQIKDCALLIPIISAATQARREGYFRLEWRLADQRTHLMAKGLPFLLPVVIDGTRDADAHVPDSFTEVQWTRLPGGETPPALAQRVRKLLDGDVGRDLRRRLGGDGEAIPSSGEAGFGDPTLQKKKPWLVPAIIGAVVIAVATVWFATRSSSRLPSPASSAAAPVAPPSEARQLVAKAWMQLNKTELGRSELEAAEELCKQALARDPNDADALAASSQVDAWFVYFGLQDTPERREGARAKANRAMQIDPTGYEPRLAQAVYLTRAWGNRGVSDGAPEAERMLRELLRERPAESRALLTLALLQRNAGRLTESYATFRQVTGNPAFAALAWNELGWAQYMGRDFVAAEASADRSIALQPYWANLSLKLWCGLLARGDVDQAKRILEQMSPAMLQEDYGAALANFVYYLRREPAAGLRVLNNAPRDWLSAGGRSGPRAGFAGILHEMAGHNAAARTEYTAALKVVEQRLAEKPSSPELLRWKARLLAHLGRRPEAENLFRSVWEMEGDANTYDLILLERLDEAVAALERAVTRSNSTPSGILRLDPSLDPLRENPRFLTLLVKLEAAGRGESAPAGGPIGEKKAEPDSSLVQPDSKSVAVLPFANLSGDKDQEYFSDGLTEEILNALARERDLRVPGRSSSFSFKGKNASAAEIAKALNVSRLVEGSVRKSGNKVRISVSLTRASDGFSEELGTFTEELTDIFELQDKVARVVVAKLTQRAGTKPVASLTNNPEAYDAYLRGRALQTRAAHLQIEAAAHYERAVALDPAFALAWARLAEARFRDYSGLFDRSPKLVTTSREAIDRALTAQADLPEGLIMRANWAREVAFDFTGAQRDLDRAEALQPPTAELRQAQAYLARDQGNWPEALRRVREALELDPQNGDYTNTFAINIYEPRGDWREADRLFARAMEIQGTSSVIPFRNRVVLRSAWRGPEAALRLIERAPKEQAKLDLLRADVLASLGRADEARVAVGRVEQQAPAGVRLSLELLASGSTAAGSLPMLEACGRQDLARQVAEELRTKALRQMEQGNGAPWVRRSLIQAETTLGHHAVALAALEEWRHEYERFPSVFRRIHEFHRLAIPLYAALGQADLALAQLRECSANGYRVDYTFGGALYFGPVRDDPRIQEWVKQHEEWTKALPDPIDL